MWGRKVPRAGFSGTGGHSAHVQCERLLGGGRKGERWASVKAEIGTSSFKTDACGVAFYTQEQTTPVGATSGVPATGPAGWRSPRATLPGRLAPDL